MQVEPAGGFALLGPGVRVVQRVVGNVPLACLDLPEGESPEVKQFRTHEKRILRGGTCLREACCRLVDADDGNARVCKRDVECAFARTATRIKNYFICSATRATRNFVATRIPVKSFNKLLDLRERRTRMVRNRTQVFGRCVLAHDLFEFVVYIGLVCGDRASPGHYRFQMLRRLPPVSSMSSSQKLTVFSSLFGLNLHTSWFTQV